MKKKDLYKIVKEELNNVLEEQTTLDLTRRKVRELLQRLKIDPFKLKNLLSRVGIKDEKELANLDINKIIDILRQGDNILPGVLQTAYAPLILMGTDCQEYTVNDAFLCGGSNNPGATGPGSNGTTIGNMSVFMGIGNPTETVSNADTGGCLSPPPGTTAVTLALYAQFLENIDWTDAAYVQDTMLAGFYEVGDTELDGCYGCTNPAAIAPDPSDAYISTYPGFEGDTVYNTGGSGYDPNNVPEIDDGSCVFFGCVDNSLYLSDPSDPTSTVEDPTTGQPYPNVSNHNNQASGGNPYEISACELIYIEPEEVLGCTNSLADNYDPAATEDDGSCEFIGCTDDGNQDQDWWTGDNDAGINYADQFNLATYPGIQASNYDPDANVEGGECEYDQDGDEVLDWDETEGCTDDEANNYNANATEDDGSCNFDEDDDGVNDDQEIDGCTQFPTPGIPTNAAGYEALNFNPDATEDDGTCEYPVVTNIEGCTDPDFYEYDGPFMESSPDGTIVYEVEDDGSCASLMIPGCTDDNYFGAATIAPDAASIAQGILDDYNAVAGTNLTLATNTTIVDANQLQPGDAFYNDYYNADQNYYCGAEIVYGCMDDSAGPNPDINGSGNYLALNYNPLANSPQVSATDISDPCQYDNEIYGCIDPDACNYNENATSQATSANPATGNDVNQGICEYPAPHPTQSEPCAKCQPAFDGSVVVDGTGQTYIADTDGDGVCDDDEVVGCTDPSAINYNPNATDSDNSLCQYDPPPNKCHDITARVCNVPQRRGQKKMSYAPISLGCVTINGQAINTDSPATSQFIYPLPSQGVDASGNPVSLIKQKDNMAIWQVISYQDTALEDSYQVTDLPFGNCKGPVLYDPDDSDIKIPDFKEPFLPPININPLSTDQGTTTGIDSVSPDIPVRGRREISESKKIRKALRNEYMSSKEKKLKNIIKEALKNYKK